MTCKKSEIISAINSFGAARASGDPNLIAFSGDLVGRLVETIEFAPEETTETEVVEDESSML